MYKNPENMSLENIKILIVEDDIFIADSLKISLESLGYDVAEPCLTVEDAKVALKKNYFDLAILDIQLYGKDEGIALGLFIQENYQFPFIFLTAFSDAVTVSKATQSGPSAYLVKPASTATLFATIQTALHNFSNQQIADEAEKKLFKDSFFVKNKGSIERIYWKDICCVESSKNYAVLSVCENNHHSSQKIALRGSLVNALRLMPVIYSQNFVQISRSCFVNTNMITKISKEHVWIENQQFELSSSYRKDLTHLLPHL
ncbi:MAG: response regulator transcription factor [Chitinophagales bacterium]|nr:response regulator transcription factor [Chitinophagales bacterium]